MLLLEVVPTAVLVVVQHTEMHSRRDTSTVTYRRDTSGGSFNLHVPPVQQRDTVEYACTAQFAAAASMRGTLVTSH